MRTPMSNPPLHLDAKKGKFFFRIRATNHGKRIMRIFLCAGEPSGDVHGANLVRALQERHPGLECVGFGGGKMAAAGWRLLYPLCRLGGVGVAGVLGIGRGAGGGRGWILGGPGFIKKKKKMRQEDW